MADTRAISVTKEVKAKKRSATAIPYIATAFAEKPVTYYWSHRGHVGDYRQHVTQALRSFDDEAPFLDIICEDWHVVPFGTEEVAPSEDAARLAALESRVAGLEVEVRELRQGLASGHSSAKAMQLLDGLIEAFKTPEPDGLEDVDPDILAMIFPESEPEE